MADSFAGVAMQVMTTPHTREQDSDSPVRHIPGGGTSYIDLAGQKAETLQFGLYFASFADYATLKNIVGTSGTLTYVDGSLVATLLKVGITQRFPSGIVYATADFVGTS